MNYNYTLKSSTPLNCFQDEISRIGALSIIMSKMVEEMEITWPKILTYLTTGQAKTNESTSEGEREHK